MDMRLVGTLHAQVRRRAAVRMLETGIAIAAAFDKDARKDLYAQAYPAAKHAQDAPARTPKEENEDLMSWLSSLPR